MLLTTLSIEKPWGRDALPKPFFSPDGKRIGEIWFVSPPELERLLVKYIFTSEKLSVQVHPSDEDAANGAPGDRGKYECWLIIDAEPDAKLGLGVTGNPDQDTLRAAALDGSIEDMLEWWPVRAGDFLRIPPGTIHAIGPGVSLVEVQQNSDTTYRLYDYGRPRELHLDRAVAVASREPFDRANFCTNASPGTLVNGPPFRVDLMDGETVPHIASEAGPFLVIPISGMTQIGPDVVELGQCAMVADVSEVRVAQGGRCLLATCLE